jgi:hypothetical protein
MNERIKELARQAGLIAPYGSDREGLSDFDYREFAELIVRECANVAAEHDALDIYEEIREHFGVEE